MRIPRIVRRVTRWFGWTTIVVFLLLLLVVVGWGILSRGRPDLEPWHAEAPASEVRAADVGPGFTLADYLRREDAAMREVQDRIEARTPSERQMNANRYDAGSPLNPRRFARNWNRSFELVPPGPPSGGVLLVHGMTDGPYSMRHVAPLFQRAGFYALALRMPGHGTVPGGLARVHWRDWQAAVRMGVRHVRERIGPGKPLVLVGYSNGGALAVQYTLDALDDGSLPRPDRLVLLSPMIGVTPFARLSRLISRLSAVPYFNRSAWTSVLPEYNPFKYNSFPTNAGYQSYLLTREIDRRMARAQESGRLAGFPPVLTFQSIVDSTVLTGAIVDRLYDRLPANGSALVMFDLNRFSVTRFFMRAEVDQLFVRLFQRSARRYRISVVSNANAETLDVVEKDVTPGSTGVRDRPLGLSWPRGVFSLSHIAVPFPVTDPLYGLQPDMSEDYGIRLGQLEPRGERGVLLMTVDDVMRLSCNPFFPYMEERIREWIGH